MINEAIASTESITRLSSLQEKLNNERKAHALSETVSHATRAIETIIPDPTRVINSDEWHGDIMFGNIDQASSRLQIRLVNNAATEQGLDILNGDSLTIGQGPRVIWEITENGSASLRYSDPGGKLKEQISRDRKNIQNPFNSIVEKLNNGEIEALTDDTFSLDQSNIDIVLCFMELDPKENNPIKTTAKFLETLYSLPVHLSGDKLDPTISAEGVYFDEDGNLIKILRETDRNSGVYRGIYFEPYTKVDPSQTSFKLGLEIDTERAVIEKSHNGKLSEISFLESNTGKTLVRTIEVAGLKPSESLKEIFESIAKSGSVYDTRYGNNYSELTRELAKIIASKDRGLDKLFENDDAIELLSTIDVTLIDNEPAKLLFSLLQQAVNPDRDVHHSDIPVFDGQVHIRESGCKDAEYYFTSSIAEGKVSVHELNGVKMLHKHLGGKTAINLDPVMYKGIEIPAGGLFQRHINEETKETSYVLMRITSFSFNDLDAADAFTWQYTENSQNGYKPSQDSLFGHRKLTL